MAPFLNNWLMPSHTTVGVAVLLGCSKSSRQYMTFITYLLTLDRILLRYLPSLVAGARYYTG